MLSIVSVAFTYYVIDKSFVGRAAVLIVPSSHELDVVRIAIPILLALQINVAKSRNRSDSKSYTTIMNHIGVEQHVMVKTGSCEQERVAELSEENPRHGSNTKK